VIARFQAIFAGTIAAFRANPTVRSGANRLARRDSRLALHRLRPLLAARGADGMVAAAMAIFISATWRSSTAIRCCLTPSNSVPLIAAGDVIYDLASC